MKVVAKFAVLFFALSVALLGVYGYVAARAEAQAISRSVETDTRELGEDLREVLVAAWTRDGEERALALLEAVQRRRGDVTLRWSREIASADHVETSATREGRVVRATLPVRVGAVGGTLEVSRSVLDEGAVLREQLRAQLAVAAALAVSAAGLAVVLGGALIGRPLQRVVGLARRVGAGDFSQRLEPTANDEIGALERELDVMCDRIAEAQQRAEAESTARVETLEQLRHLDRLRTVGTLASSLAHELGTPLNVLLIRGQALATEDTSPDEVRDAGSVILAQVEKMRRLVNQLLDFSRRKAGARGEVRLSDVAERSLRLLRSLAEKHGVRLRVTVRHDARVLGDAGYLEQAVTNLVVNGVQAMPDGGDLEIVVDAAESAPEGRSLPQSGPVALIQVVDHGVGLTEAALARIFEPFYTTKPPGAGTGLGLTVAADIARDHGGAIDATSAAGRGSTFSLCLPRLS